MVEGDVVEGVVVEGGVDPYGRVVVFPRVEGQMKLVMGAVLS